MKEFQIGDAEVVRTVGPHYDLTGYPRCPQTQYSRLRTVRICVYTASPSKSLLSPNWPSDFELNIAVRGGRPTIYGLALAKYIVEDSNTSIDATTQTWAFIKFRADTISAAYGSQSMFDSVAMGDQENIP